MRVKQKKNTTSVGEKKQKKKKKGARSRGNERKDPISLLEEKRTNNVKKPTLTEDQCRNKVPRAKWKVKTRIVEGGR